MLEENKQYWIGFNLVRGIGAVRLRQLLQHFGDLKTAWHASPAELRAAGLSDKLVQNVSLARANMDFNKIRHRIQELGVRVVTWDDEDYPRHLRSIDQPPPVLYLRGTLEETDHWAVAIVGTRRITAYGRQVTEQLATTLAQNGVTVISGLARGVDSVAHQAALNAGGRTIAVLGSGVDHIYPPENRQLAERMIAQGAIISDYALGTPPDGANFPPRNRIISGLSMAVVVVEAGRKSGALITAQFAADQGREVYAVPGNITAPQSKGTNRLIQQGAHPLLAPQELLEQLNLSRITQHREARKILPANELEAKLLETISTQPLHVDEISVQCQLPIGQVSATLAMMELKGMVRQVGGMHYVALREIQADYSVE